MHALKSRRSTSNLLVMKPRDSVKFGMPDHSPSGRADPLTGFITLSEKDFEQFEKNVRANPRPTPSAKRAMERHATIDPRIRS